MRWKNPLSSGLKRSIETLPDRMMQGFGVGMEMSRMRAAREQAERARADEAARYRQETARRAQERQEDIGWRTAQAKTAAEQWEAGQALKRQMFEADQAERERQRQADIESAPARAEAERLKSEREAQKFQAELDLLRARRARELGAAGLYGAQAKRSKAEVKGAEDKVRQFQALTTFANALGTRLNQLEQSGAYDESAYNALQGLYDKAVQDLDELSGSFKGPSAQGASFNGPMLYDVMTPFAD